MKNILLPTDFSANAEMAVDYAVQLFKKTPCRFHLLHAYHSAPSAPGNKLTATADLEQIIKKLRDGNDNPNHSFEWTVLTDTVLSALEKTIKEKNVDLVIMGTKGSSALREIFMGSITVSVIRYLEGCPVLAIPEDHKFRALEEILFATDFKHCFNPKELAPLVDMAQLFDSELVIAYVDEGKAFSDLQNANREELIKNLKGPKFRVLETDKQESVAKTISQLEKVNSKISMVSLLHTQHGYFQKWVREPVIRNIVFETKLPVLVLSMDDQSLQ